jgi:carbamoyl-phosphate synthase large subunit
MNKIKKVLVLGSGALKIGEAGEFDYSGSQAIKALKEEGKKVILVNPNIATIQTSKELADEVYFLPVTPHFVEKVIAKEKPDGIFLSFGGQTALNCGLALHKSGILKKHNVKILGTPISAIILTEDRDKFTEHLGSINIPTPRSHAAETLKQAQQFAEEIGYPVMIRAGFALGGHGSGVAFNELQLKNIVNRALAFAPQVLIEQYLHHYKEIEYEVVRDKDDNCITVCNMENMDPLGIHTGESVVVAPSQTLTNNEYHTLRKASIDIVRSLGIVGECNVQFALNPNPDKNRGGGRGGPPSSARNEVRTSDGGDARQDPERQEQDIDYYVIEVNARLSRSSALASKATGYPLAYVAAKLALGYNLTNLKNKVTGVTQACFEPALDYIVTKIPRWDLDKFKGADQQLGSSMKSVGEVMGIGRTFEESFQKAIRMLDMEQEGATSEKLFFEKTDIRDTLKNPTPKRMFAIARALKNNISVEEIHELSGIDPWFIERIKNIVDHETKLKQTKKIEASLFRKLKQLGLSDKRIGELTGKTGLEIRTLRKKLNILPSVLQIDTLAGEFPAQTNYLYMTYNENHHDVTPSGKNAVLVLGSGPYHIGSSVEFDWCSVNTVSSLKKYKKKSIIINCNPETVSTDYDISDRLYFEELTFERIADIYEYENPLGAIVSVGGQTPNNRAKAMHQYGITMLGTSPVNIDRAEDRNKFSSLLDKLSIKQPAWKAFSTLTKAEKFAEAIGYPVLIRPSYVLSGSAMNVCFNRQDLEKYLEEATSISKDSPVTVSKFFTKAMEVELDAVAQNGEVKAAIISEHVEYAGVHSGDATIVLPAKTVNEELQEKMKKIAHELAKELNITGPFNIQFLVRDNEIYIIETNLRASRTFPFIAKVTGINLIELFVDVLFKKTVASVPVKPLNFSAVKVAQFSFARLIGAHPRLGVEMASTGEVACFGRDVKEAYLKGILATGGKIPEKGIFVSLGGDQKKKDLLESCRLLPKLNLPIYATERTAKFLNKNGIRTIMLYKIHEEIAPNILDYFQAGRIDLVINVVDTHLKKDLNDDYFIRRAAVDSNILVLTKIKKTELFIQALVEKGLKKLEIKPWSEYTKETNV